MNSDFLVCFRKEESQTECVDKRVREREFLSERDERM
ncbi:hypothetical protein COLO4_25469 [Corchorus olitorius]|uniref:Uncharacterized protein n=1 Tax=Corchorus olitorius TaxID=93759 RepID=A0A1R3I2C1_9ROSI|nr:hypothetical protein COLO4_25469 [Corchorus olitorius]